MRLFDPAAGRETAGSGTTLSGNEMERYRRQLMLDGFSEAHQERLKSSAALVAGIGGLGGAAALYLAAAGIGKLRLVHSGDLTLSNMNRQVLMKDYWIGESRVVMAKRTIEEINEEVEIEIFDKRVPGENAKDLIEGVQLAVSARPNFPERKSLNKACVEAGIPMVEAAVNAMEGYLFTIFPGKTACLECVYPQDNPEWKELGFPVLGAVSGALGCMMAVEAIKILSGYGTPLLSKMLLFNMADMEFRKVNIHRDPACSVCGSLGEL